MTPSGANDDAVVSLTDAEALVAEVQRLRTKVTDLNCRLQELHQLAYSDPLLGIANRRGFLACLERLISRVDRYGCTAAMLFVDVDGLKEINDKFGHKAGDAALARVAEMLTGCVRKSDTVARLGGDEFGILLEQADELSAWQLALRVVETVVGSEFCVDGICLPLSVAVGVGVVKPGDSPAAVLERADREMYRIKAG
jgi:diguanylate cyclase (GGDEF)-like protein